MVLLACPCIAISSVYQKHPSWLFIVERTVPQPVSARDGCAGQACALCANASVYPNPVRVLRGQLLTRDNIKD